MSKTIADYPCSGAFREYEAELNGEKVKKPDYPKPLSGADFFIKKSKGLVILEKMMGIHFVPYQKQKIGRRGKWLKQY